MSQHQDPHAHDAGAAHDAHAAGHIHIVPLKIYFAVYGALLVLTALTVAISFVHLGFMNVPVALAIATVKASIVALFFMHLLYDERFNGLVFVMGLVFLGVFISMTLIDPMTRGKVYRAEYGPIHPPTLIRAKEHLAPENAGAAPVAGSGEPLSTVATPDPHAKPVAPEFSATESAVGESTPGAINPKSSADAVLQADTHSTAGEQVMRPSESISAEAQADQRINDSPTSGKP